MRKIIFLAAILAVPAAAYAMKAAPKQPLCFASGASTYQIVANATAPDYRIRIDAEAVRPDLRMQLVDRAENADFVLVDDFSGNEPRTCKSSTPIRTVTLDTATGQPDVTVRLSADGKGADYRLFVHSARFSQQDAAALLAAMWKSNQRQVDQRKVDQRKVAWTAR